MLLGCHSNRDLESHWVHCFAQSLLPCPLITRVRLLVWVSVFSLNIANYLQQSLDYAESQYSAHVNTGCCSEVCTRGQSFNHDACNGICSSDHIGSYRRTQYYWGRSEDALEFESDFSSAFCRDVTLNESAVHIPVNIYEQGCVLTL